MRDGTVEARNLPHSSHATWSLCQLQPAPQENACGDRCDGQMLRRMQPNCAARRQDGTMPAYDDQNIFAKILRGEIPCFKVYENERTFAFLDIMPRSPGHTLVIPKAPTRGILDISADDFAEVARTAKTIAIAAMKAFHAEGIIVQQFSEAASGQIVFHLHMHVMPMTSGVDLLPAQSRKEDVKVLEDHATRMIAALGGN
jgi:histidine triad (HIT) family protein